MPIRIMTCLLLGTWLALALPLAAWAEPTAQATVCQRDYLGIEHCALDNGRTQIVRIDLTNRQIHFDVVTASNALGPNPPAWNAGYRQTVAQMAGAHPSFDGIPLAVAVTADYGAGNGSHGWEGFMVQRGQRLDGPGVDAPDCDCAFYERSSLTLSRLKPTQAAIGRYAPVDFAQYNLYASRCAGSPAFAACEADFLQRTPAPDEQQRYEARLRDQWYTAVGGGPTIVRNGRVVPISQACREERFGGDWCSDNPNVGPDRLRQLRMGSVAGVTADGRQLILIVTTERLPNELSQLLVDQGAQVGIRFDGSASAQMWYDDAEWTGNTRPISNALLVYAEPLPDYHASPASAPLFDVVVAGQEAQVFVQMRNEGRLAWSGPAFELVAVGGSLSDAPDRLPLAGPVPSGDIATWQIEIPTGGRSGIPSVRYRMHHEGVPFSDDAVVYVVVLPEQLSDLEHAIRERIQQWQQQGQQTIDDLLAQIADMIAQAATQQAHNLLDELIASCCGSSTLLAFGVASVLLPRRPRSTSSRRSVLRLFSS